MRHLESNTLETMWKLMSAVMSLYAGCANSRQNVAEILISLHVLYLTRWKEWEINLFRQNLLVFFASGTGIEASIFNGGGKAYRWISVKDYFKVVHLVFNYFSSFCQSGIILEWRREFNFSIRFVLPPSSQFLPVKFGDSNLKTSFYDTFKQLRFIETICFLLI